jgi:hypothetical protein
MLLMHVDRQGWDSFATDWSQDDVKTMVEVMQELNKDLREAGELVELNGLSGPGAAQTVRAQQQGGPLVTDGIRDGATDCVIGYWVVDVASPERMVEIAARISATPGPGGAPVNLQVEVHPIGEAPEV